MPVHPSAHPSALSIHPVHSPIPMSTRRSVGPYIIPPTRPSVRLSIHPSVHPHIPSIWPPIRPPIHSFCPPIRPVLGFVRSPVGLAVSPSVHHPSGRPPIHTSIHPSVHPPVHPPCPSSSVHPSAGPHSLRATRPTRCARSRSVVSSHETTVTHPSTRPSIVRLLGLFPVLQ